MGDLWRFQSHRFQEARICDESECEGGAHLRNVGEESPDRLFGEVLLLASSCSGKIRGPTGRGADVGLVSQFPRGGGMQIDEDDVDDDKTEVLEEQERW